MPQDYNVTALMRNHDGDLDDFLLDTDDFDGTEEDALASSDEYYSTFDDEELDPISAAAAEPLAVDFDESTELMEGGLEDAFDASIDAKLNKAVAELNPQAIEAIMSEGTFNIPEADPSTKSLAEYVKTIQESFDKYIDQKIAKYSK